MQWSKASILALVGLAFLLAWVRPVLADDPVPSRDPAVFKLQLRQASLLCKRMAQEIQSLPSDDPAPVDPALKGRAHQAYALLRAARWGMELAKQREESYQDPMLDLAYKRVDQAFNLARYPVDSTGAPRSEYISNSVQNLNQAIRLINQALVILP